MAGANEVAATRGQDKTSHNIDDMVLMSQEWRKTNEQEPKHHRIPEKTARMAGVNADQ